MSRLILECWTLSVLEQVSRGLTNQTRPIPGDRQLHGRTWNSETESSLAPRSNRAFSTHVPRLLCQTSRRPLCLLR